MGIGVLAGGPWVTAGCASTATNFSQVPGFEAYFAHFPRSDAIVDLGATSLRESAPEGAAFLRPTVKALNMDASWLVDGLRAMATSGH